MSPPRWFTKSDLSLLRDLLILERCLNNESLGPVPVQAVFLLLEHFFPNDSRTQRLKRLTRLIAEGFLVFNQQAKTITASLKHLTIDSKLNHLPGRTPNPAPGTLISFLSRKFTPAKPPPSRLQRKCGGSRGRVPVRLYQALVNHHFVETIKARPLNGRLSAEVIRNGTKLQSAFVFRSTYRRHFVTKYAGRGNDFDWSAKPDSLQEALDMGFVPSITLEQAQQLIGRFGCD